MGTKCKTFQIVILNHRERSVNVFTRAFPSDIAGDELEEILYEEGKLNSDCEFMFSSAKLKLNINV